MRHATRCCVLERSGPACFLAPDAGCRRRQSSSGGEVPLLAQSTCRPITSLHPGRSRWSEPARLLPLTIVGALEPRPGNGGWWMFLWRSPRRLRTGQPLARHSAPWLEPLQRGSGPRCLQTSPHEHGSSAVSTRAKIVRDCRIFGRQATEQQRSRLAPCIASVRRAPRAHCAVGRHILGGVCGASFVTVECRRVGRRDVLASRYEKA
jgi:hypothetical protein